MVRDRIPPSLGVSQKGQRMSVERDLMDHLGHGLICKWGLLFTDGWWQGSSTMQFPPVSQLTIGWLVATLCLSDRIQIIAKKWKLEARPWPQGGFGGGTVNCMSLHHPPVHWIPSSRGEMQIRRCLGLPSTSRLSFISTKPFMPGTNMYWSSIMCFYYVAGK